MPGWDAHDPFPELASGSVVSGGVAKVGNGMSIFKGRVARMSPSRLAAVAGSNSRTMPLLRQPIPVKCPVLACQAG